MIQKMGFECVLVSSKGELAQDIKCYIDIMDRLSPELTVCDWLLSFHTAARIRKVPCVCSLLRSEQFVGYEPLNKGMPDKFLSRSSERVRWLNSQLDEFGLPPVEDLREALIGDVNLIPSTPALDPLPPLSEHYARKGIAHIGPLFLGSDKMEEVVLSRMNKMRKTGDPIAVITLGTAYGRQEYTVYECLIRQMTGSGFATVCIVPSDDVRMRLRVIYASDEKVLILPFIDLLPIFRFADMIIHHGGHATALIGMMSGTPAVTLPSCEVDRADTASRLEALGVSKRYVAMPRGPALPELAWRVLHDTNIATRTRIEAQYLKRFIKYRGPRIVMASFVKALDTSQRYYGGL